jgi:putative ABC transport system permease protein
MITHFSQALRSLLAHRRKTWAVVASIGLGISALLLVGGYYEYNYWGLSNSLIHSQYAHLQIYPTGYQTDRDINPFAHRLDRVDDLLSLLRSDPAIAVAAPRSRAWGLANGEPVEIRGVDPAEEAKIFTFITQKHGHWLSAGEQATSQVAPLLADRLHVALGGQVSLTAVRPDSQQNAVDTRPTSIVGSFAEEFDRTTVTVPQATYTDLFGTDDVHEIAVLLRDDDTASQRDRLQSKLNAVGWPVEITTWYDQARYFRQVVEYYEGFYRIVLWVVAMVVFFATGTTMTLALLERSREFGTRLSLGNPPNKLVGQVLLETGLAGLIGVAVGSLAAFAIAKIINAGGGILMPAAPGLSTAVHIYIAFSPQAAGLSLVCGLLVPLIAVAFPAYRLFKKTIVELLV